MLHSEVMGSKEDRLSRTRRLYEDFQLVQGEELRRRRESGINYFTPNKPQLEASQSPAAEVVFVGGNRSSKSTCGATMLVSHLTGTYRRCDCHGEWFSKEHRFRLPIRAVVVATEFPIIERVIERRIMEYLPRKAIHKIKRTPQGYMQRLEMVNGSTVDVLTNEMAQMAFESADWDFAWIDEPTQKSKYYAIQRGLLDRAGQSILTFTPLIEPWMKEELVDKADGRRRSVVHAITYDNTKNIHGGSILNADHIKRLEEDMPEDLKRTRIFGEFFHMRGVAWPEFTHSVHTQTWAYQYPDPVICVLDPHTRKPHHVIWAFVRRDDTVCVDRELVFRGTLPELSKAILQVEAQAGYNMKRRLIDPNYGKTPNNVTGRTVVDEMAAPPFVVRFGLANDAIDAGILKVASQLHYDRQKPIDNSNSPRLFFHRDRCPTTIRSVKNYQHQDWSGKLKDDRDVKETIKPKDTDGADCVRYLISSSPSWRVLSGQVYLNDQTESYY